MLLRILNCHFRHVRLAECFESGGWSVGEGALAEVLQARRLAVEARLGAEQLQLDALEAQARLLLDAHRLWADD